MNEWFNLERYSVGQLVLFGIAALFWVITYILVIKDGFKKQYVGIPIAAIAANFAWEILWSTVFHTDMGLFFEWGYRIWCILDIVIVYLLFQYGYKQIDNKNQRQAFKPLFIFGVIGWMVGIYFFTKEYIDPIGAVAAYLVNANMSLLFILLVLRQPKEIAIALRYDVAWYKMLGTTLTSVFCFWAYPDQHFMLAMTVITFILDIIYIYLVGKFRKEKI
ncbi:hypothetical protein [Bernardetia sp. MNP-M8]|uniref:transmembrane-type terpene cyclase n=1 Tax=Bernardetia sp. MNP-M8 TaxID=3127470 RepID=UPI0030CF24F7